MSALIRSEEYMRDKMFGSDASISGTMDFKKVKME